ncbi:MAG: hypothetical protein NXH70_15745 [Hyphomonas sp.]|nr:hypothetical protein [Hyphomonas sp.]
MGSKLRRSSNYEGAEQRMMSLSEDAKFEALTSHYENTFQQTMKVLSRRDRSFLLIIFILGLFWLQVWTPSELNKAAAAFWKSQIGNVANINVQLLDSLLWCALLGVTIRYFQICVHVERLYEYIHALEDEISPNYSGAAFTREGRSYLNDYPVYRKWASFIYTVFFPSLIVMTISFKIWNEYNSIGITPKLWFDGTIFLATFVTLSIYVLPKAVPLMKGVLSSRANLSSRATGKTTSMKSEVGENSAAAKIDD